MQIQILPLVFLITAIAVVQFKQDAGTMILRFSIRLNHWSMCERAAYGTGLSTRNTDWASGDICSYAVARMHNLRPPWKTSGNRLGDSGENLGSWGEKWTWLKLEADNPNKPGKIQLSIWQTAWIVATKVSKCHHALELCGEFHRAAECMVTACGMRSTVGEQWTLVNWILF